MLSAVPFVIPFSDADDAAPAAARHGSADESAADRTVAAAVDIPWDTYLGDGAAGRVRDGSLALVRHAYPATAATDMRAASTSTGQLLGDAAVHERVAAIGLSVAAAHHRPARMPHRPGDEPHAWWIPEERTLVWMPWGDIDEPPYGLGLLDNGEADSVVILAPDAVWTVYVSGIPRIGTRGGWDDLPERIRVAIGARVEGDLRSALWRRDGDSVVVRWKHDGRLRTATIEVNRLRYLSDLDRPNSR